MSTAPELTARSTKLEEHFRDYQVIVANSPGLQRGLSFEAYLVYATAEIRDKLMREQLENVIHLLNRLDR
ncbi:hypothetical protein [Hymenobacter jeollabukensis]|uniref:Four helix bundle protein n=1 Tax=Hymenobacter jeollabukensis TaxID=2025313 RepID=A0A5R8WKI9_9BACT|nr:hypothetical protein [Hymenobacter jeollabukensis]TLM89551.1 hypothetical protein FDY95_20995 [Hymenobacter jeollabukensis]